MSVFFYMKVELPLFQQRNLPFSPFLAAFSLIVAFDGLHTYSHGGLDCRRPHRCCDIYDDNACKCGILVTYSAGLAGCLGTIFNGLVGNVESSGDP